MSNQSATVKPQAKANQPPAKASRQRWRLLRQLHEIIEGPMAIFAILWLVLVVLEFTRGLNGFLRGCGYALWAIFLVDLGLEFLVAPDRLGYLKRHWLYVISLLIPGIGVFRVFRVLRLVRGGMSLGVLLSSINSSVRTLRVHLKKRGFGYVAVLTLAITLAGAAGVYSFENSLEL